MEIQGKIIQELGLREGVSSVTGKPWKMAEVNLEQAKLRTELQRLQLQRTELSQAWHGMDMERKAVCETFYEMKHRLIVQNPRIVPEKKTIG